MLEILSNLKVSIMKKKRFTETQIVSILHQQEAYKEGSQS
jgi:hypothetical protein